MQRLYQTVFRWKKVNIQLWNKYTYGKQTLSELLLVINTRLKLSKYVSKAIKSAVYILFINDPIFSLAILSENGKMFALLRRSKQCGLFLILDKK